MAHTGPLSTTDVTSDACGRSLAGKGVPVNARGPVAFRGWVPADGRSGTPPRDHRFLRRR